jgi:hypothetical protein
VLTERFSDSSDVEVLVEFLPDTRVGYLKIAAVECELSRVFGGRKVDVRTPGELSRYFRDEVVRAVAVISYLAAGTSEIPATALRQAVTRRWWEQERHKYDLFASEAVENECRRGDPSQARMRLRLIEGTTTIALNRSIMELAKKLVVPGGLPEAAPDAVHIAAATIFQIDYPATWNIRHIANAQIRRITEGVLEDNGYRGPIICTPEELFALDALER